MFFFNSTCRPHSRHPAAQEEEEEEERHLSSRIPANGHSLAAEAGADPPLSQQRLPSAGDEGDEGSCELSDEVSRDSTMGSDSDTFSSPFCLSPVSEALCESSGSVFLDSESRSAIAKTFPRLIVMCNNSVGLFLIPVLLVSPDMLISYMQILVSKHHTCLTVTFLYVHFLYFNICINIITLHFCCIIIIRPRLRVSAVLLFGFD